MIDGVTDDEAMAHYATLSMAELRRYQGIVQAQMPMAYERRNEGALATLQHMDELVTAAIYKKAFA